MYEFKAETLPQTKQEAQDRTVILPKNLLIGDMFLKYFIHYSLLILCVAVYYLHVC